MSDTTSTPVQPIRPDDAPPTRMTVANAAEYAAIAHVRGWQHYGPICPVCINFEYGRQSVRSADALAAAHEAGYRKAIDEIAGA